METAIYTRKSTLKLGQKETIENQIKICKRKAKEMGLIIVDIKIDSATGTDDNNRPEVKELIRDAVNGKYSCVIMKGISRLYRKTSKGLELIEKLDQNGIRVITVEEHFDSQAPENRTATGKLDLSRLTMYLMFAEMESKKLADRVKLTQIEKAHAGEWNQASSVPFGYDYDPSTKKLVVNKSKAEIIKMIFDMYLSGMGIRTIARYLNGNNENRIVYPSPKDKQWSDYTIGFILKNEVYVGRLVYNKRSKKERPYKSPEAIGKSHDDIYIGNDYNEKDKWIIINDAHEAIIDPLTFEKAQEMMNTKAIRKGVRNNVSLFASIAKCGLCGSGMTFKRGFKTKDGKIKSSDKYYCANYIRYGNQNCTSHHIRAIDLEETIISKLEELTNNEAEQERIFQESIKSFENLNKNFEKEINKIKNEIEQVSRKMDKLLEKNMDGQISDIQFETFNKRYSDELEMLTKQLAQLKIKSEAASDHEKQQKQFKKMLKEIYNIRSKSTEEKRYIFLKLIEHIIIKNGVIQELKLKIL